MIEHIKVVEYPEQRLIVITSDFRIKGLYLFLKDFYSLMLEKVFEGCDVNIITLNPISDAVCYDLGEYSLMKINKEKIIINNIQNISSKMLIQIACSTEFELGTLAVVKQSDSSSLEERVKMVYKYFNEDIEAAEADIPYTFCYCEPDGYIMYLVGSNLKETDVRQIAERALTSA